MRTELLVRAVVGAFAEQMEIELAHQLTVAVRIVDLADEALGLGDAQAIVEDALLAGELGGKRNALWQAKHLVDAPDAVGIDAHHLHAIGRGLQRPDDHPARIVQQDDVGTEDGERVAVGAGAERIEGVLERVGRGNHGAQSVSGREAPSQARRSASVGRSPGPPMEETPLV